MSDLPTSAEDFEELRKQQEMIRLMREQMAAQQSSGSTGGMNPMAAMQFMPGQTTGASAAPTAGGGQTGGMLAGAGPWMALGAAIIGNETYQNKQGNRPEEFGDHMKALASGEVLEMDAKKYIGGPVGDFVGTLSSPKGIGTHIKKSLKPWEWFD
jgi:hypothetical protein